jgi:hypothetical protein
MYENEKVLHMVDSFPSTSVVVQKALYGVDVKVGLILSLMAPTDTFGSQET